MKLTEPTIARIRALRAQGVSVEETAQRVGCGRSSVIKYAAVVRRTALAAGDARGAAAQDAAGTDAEKENAAKPDNAKRALVRRLGMQLAGARAAQKAASRHRAKRPCENCRWRQNKADVPVCGACYREVLGR